MCVELRVGHGCLHIGHELSSHLGVGCGDLSQVWRLTLPLRILPCSPRVLLSACTSRSQPPPGPRNPGSWFKVKVSPDLSRSSLAVQYHLLELFWQRASLCASSLDLPSLDLPVSIVVMTLISPGPSAVISPSQVLNLGPLTP